MEKDFILVTPTPAGLADAVKVSLFKQPIIPETSRLAADFMTMRFDTVMGDMEIFTIEISTFPFKEPLNDDSY